MRQYACWAAGAFAAVIALTAFSFRASRLSKKISREIRARVLAEAALKESAEELARLTEEQSLLLGHARDMVYRHDTQGVFTYFSPSVENITGYSVEESLSNYPSRLTDNPENKKAAEHTANMLKTGAEGPPYYMEIYHKDGRRIWIEVNERPYFKDGKIAGIVGVARDATDRRRAEAGLLEAKEQAEEAAKLKDKFVSLVAHDLKAPLFAITGFLSIILNDRNDPLHQDHREMVEQAHEAGTRLFRMIEGLLNISRLQTGKLVPQKKFFDGRWAAAAAIDSLKQLAREKGIELVNKVPHATRLYADMDLFREVLQNLVSNSIKFCGKGDIITLYVPHGEDATIAVIDTGVGISDRTLPDIFKHEESTSTVGTAGEKGTGLGLPLSSDIMKAHGGTLSAASIKGEGTVFYAQLPHVKPEILIAGADGELRLLLKESAEMNEMSIIEAKSREEAVKFLDEQTPHLILMDLEASGMDGLDLLERISEGAGAKEIPVIVITGDSNMEARQRAFQLGVGDFVVKPLVLADLIPRIRRFVG